MAIIAEKKESNDFIQVEPGTYVARCYSMIEIGTVESEFKGQTKHLHKVAITWELPTELAVFKDGEEPKPFIVTKKYTLSMYEKANLRKDLESWRGKSYTDEEAERVDITKLVGQPCLLSVIQQPRKDDPKKNYVAVSSISKLMKGQECPDQINPTKILSYDNFDWNVFDSLSDYMQDMIKSTPEYKQMVEPQAVRINEQNDDEISDLPF